MVVQVVAQGECTECGESADNYTVEKRELMPEGPDRVIECECGARAIVRITEDGPKTSGPISHESASWNQNS